MSGSIGGKRILREEVQGTVDKYINTVLCNFPGFVKAEITGSYNAGTRKDHGDIDLVVQLNGKNISTVKKEFKKYLDSLDDTVTPKFIFGRNRGNKSQLYGQIVTCGFPIDGRENDYVQVDNIIVVSEDAGNFQKEFLNLDAPKQALLMGYIRVCWDRINKQEIINDFGINLTPIQNSNQEYEFVLSAVGLSLRLVTLGDDYKEISRKEIWRSYKWGYVRKLLTNINIYDSYDEILNNISNTVFDQRSKRRIIGIMKSMINVGVGEIGTPKGDMKIQAIKLAENIL